MIKDSNATNHNEKEKEKPIQGSMMKSFLDDKTTIKKKQTNQIQAFQNIANSSNQSIQSMMNSMKMIESKKKKINSNPNQEASFNNISRITKNENFVISDIDNSIFNEYDDWYLNNQIKYTLPPKVSTKEDEHLLQLSSYYKEKITRAQANEEIILPDVKLTINFLDIQNPIKIKGQVTSCLEITEGPILIHMTNNAENDSVKISQLKICFNHSGLPNWKKDQQKTTLNLFNLYQGSLLELEDCDVTYQGKRMNQHLSTGVKLKSVAFLLYPCKKDEENEEITSLLTITNTRVHNFYQTVRSGQNCILNINKSYITQNYGKSIVIINPLILKITETSFEQNADDALHVKFIKNEYFKENRKFFFCKNTFEMNMGNAICLEGIKNFKFDLSIAMSENKFRYNNSDGVIVWDLTYDQFDICQNIFEKNKGNGLNIQKVFPNTIESNNETNNKLNIKDNTFKENYGFGLFVNDSQLDSFNNTFMLNKASGMILCNLVLDNPKIGLEVLRSHNYTSSLSTEGSNGIISIDKKSSKLSHNNYFENGESGLRIINYIFPVTCEENVFRENCEHGIFIDLDSANNSINSTLSSAFTDKIKLYKNADSPQVPSMANLFLSRCIIEKNLQSGISMNNCFIYCEDSFIIDNIGYAIYTSKKEFQACFKESKYKNSKNTISGTLGGEWGEININSKTSCSYSCTSSSNNKKITKADIEQEVKGKGYKDNEEDENEVKKQGKNGDKHKDNTNKNNDKDNGCVVH